jgi:hypothetical protein
VPDLYYIFGTEAFRSRDTIPLRANNGTYFVRILIHPAGILVTTVRTVGLLVAEQVLGNALACKHKKTGFAKSNARAWELIIPTGRFRHKNTQTKVTFA